MLILYFNGDIYKKIYQIIKINKYPIDQIYFKKSIITELRYLLICAT